jgi:hypothetical protein
VTYTGTISLAVNGNGGADTFVVSGDVAPVTLTAGADGGVIFDIRSASFPVTVDTTASATSGAADSVFIGNTSSSAAAAGAAGPRSLAAILTTVTINGSGRDSLTVSDSAASTGRSLGLTDSTSTILVLDTTAVSSIPTVTFSGVTNLSLLTGSGADTVTVNSIPATVTTSINTGAGNDTVNVLGAADTLAIATGSGTNTVNLGASTLDLQNVAHTTIVAITGTLSINGTGGTTTLNVNDSGATSARFATLTSSSLSGLSAANPITFTGVSTLNLQLGSIGDSLTINAPGSTTAFNITGGPGSDSITISAEASPVTLTLGSATDSVKITNLNNVTGAVTVTGVASGSDTLLVDDTAATVARTEVLNGGSLTGPGPLSLSFTNISSLSMNLGSGNDAVTVQAVPSGTNLAIDTGAGNNAVSLASASTSPISITGGPGNDSVTVQAIAGPTTLDLGAGTNSVLVSDASTTLTGITGALSIGGSNVALTVDASGSSSGLTGTINPSSIVGFGLGTGGAITFAGVTSLTVRAGHGNNNITVAGTPTGATTALYAGDGNDTVTLQANGGPTSINAGNGNDAVTVASLSAPASIALGTGTDSVTVASVNGVGGAAADDTLDVLGASLSISGTGSDALLIDDSGSLLKRTLTLSATALTGLQSGAVISFSGLTSLELKLSSAGTTLAISGTPASPATTTIAGQAGNDTINVTGSAGLLTLNASSGTTAVTVAGIGGPVDLNANADGTLAVAVADGADLSNIAGALTVSGAGATSLTVTTLTTAPQSVSLDSGDLTGLTPAPIDFSSLTNLTVNLGDGNDLLTVNAAPATDANTLDLTAGGSDQIEIAIASGNGPLAVVLGDSGSHVRVHTIASAASPVTVSSDASSAQNTFTLGYAATGAAVLGALDAPLTLVGSGDDQLSIDDSGSSVGRTLAITSTTLTGLGDQGVTYSGMSSVGVSLGSGADNVTIASTDSAATYSLSTGGGNDGVVISATASPLILDLGAGSNAVSITAAGAPVSITTPAGTGTTSVSLGGTLGVTANITASVTIAGPGPLTINDADGTRYRNIQLSNGRITGALGNISSRVVYSGIDSLAVFTAGVGSSTTVLATPVPTTLTGGAGNDVVAVAATTDPLTIDGGGGSGDAVSIGDVNASTLASITGSINISNDETLTFDDSARTTGVTAVLTSSTFAGATAANVSFSGVELLSVTLGSGNDTLNVPSTPNATITLAAGPGTNAINLGEGSSAQLLGAIQVVSTGTDQLNVNDSTTPTARTVTLAPGRISGLTASPINFSGVTTLLVELGSGGNTVALGSTSAANTTVNTGPGNDAVTVDTSTVASANVPAGTILLNTDGGKDSVTIHAIRAVDNLTVTDASGTSAVLVPISPAIAGTLTVDGTGSSTVLTLDASALTTGETMTLNATAVSGLTAVPVTYRSLAGLVILLAKANDSVTVTATAVATPTSITSYGGDDTYTLTSPTLHTAFGGPLTLDPGSGQNHLVIIGGDTTAYTLTVTPTSITGAGAGVTILSPFQSVNVNAGPAATVSVSSNFTNPITLGGSGPLTFPGNLSGPVTLAGSATGTITITGSLLGELTVSGPLGSLSIGGALSGSVTIQGNLGSGAITGALSGTLTINGNAGPLTVGSLTGSLTIYGTSGGLTDAGPLSGQVNISGDLTSLSVTGLISGSVTDGGSINNLVADGGLSGLVSAVGTIVAALIQDRFDGLLSGGSVPNVRLSLIVPTGTGGQVLRIDADGITRTLSAVGGTTSSTPSGQPAATGVSFSGQYDVVTTAQPNLVGADSSVVISTPQPSIALKMIGSGGPAFDLIAIAPAGSALDLSRMEGRSSGASVGLRNLAIDGSLLTALTPRQQAFFSSTGGSAQTGASTPTGGIYLPTEALAAVSFRDAVTSTQYVQAASLQAFSFSTLIGPLPGQVRSATHTRIAGEAVRTNFGLFNLSPKHKQLTVFLPITEPLLIRLPGNGEAAGVFVRGSVRTQFSKTPLVLSGQNASGAAGSALVTYNAGRKFGVSSIAFSSGTSGSVLALYPVSEISGDTSLNDIELRGNNHFNLRLDAPGSPRKLLISGGKLIH